MPGAFLWLTNPKIAVVDVRLSGKQDVEAAKAFFAQAYEVAQQPPQRVATMGTRATRERSEKRLEKELNTRLEIAEGIRSSGAIEG